ncbi:hypothetical protein ['Catharanthus roseus' aster yellows phytoplasma]|uniref:Uncharacterized protein n=1 Tax='Catharanthus roseus' aster yellows phytoplasma TaxID=1193712 RepID=A0A4P6MA51_9MOLU|nr:hypothetical protein ['Catharanthus roseus' aster yellows phytoplasma]QBF23694.1 hypothetical protein EXT02_00420 ['Catharanthus roseus' aster yellows phytoplasma]
MFLLDNLKEKIKDNKKLSSVAVYRRVNHKRVIQKTLLWISLMLLFLALSYAVVWHELAFCPNLGEIKKQLFLNICICLLL